jgi:ferredoxin--NADP+ reductase
MGVNETETPLRVAVVGSGPAGFYATGALLADGAPVEVDMIERLPTPWGLVRLGVAPDHPKIKSVSRAFERIAERPGFRFLGNVEVGRDVMHDDLIAIYDAVIYAVGAQTDRRLGIPGEDLRGSWPATEFVAWYNGHPDHTAMSFDLSGERAVVIGNGNVAVDVARMLALTPEELAPTDTTEAAMEAIGNSGIREIVMIGRRGPVQASFTNPELLELGELAGADVIVDPVDLELDPVSAAAVEGDTNAERNMEVLREYAAREPSGKPRRIVLRFLLSPVALHGQGHVEAVELVRNRLEPDDRGGLRAVPTGELETLPAGIVFRSVGYRGVPIPGVPFDDERHTIRNADGRVLDEQGAQVPGVYATGWIKRGPSGVIGTNKKDATETVGLLLEDDAAGRVPRVGKTADDVDALLDARGLRPVVYAGWSSIDAAERAAGEKLGRPRVKLSTWDDLLATAEALAAESA